MCVLYNKKHTARRGGVPGRVCVGLKGIQCIGCTGRRAAVPVSDAVRCFSLVSVHLILLIRAAPPFLARGSDSRCWQTACLHCATGGMCLITL